jgi:murein DD-endopeptidase MepM/ murein hydrolase activator NlpD
VGVFFPAFRVGSWIFNAVVVRFYAWYLRMASRLGWKGLGRSPFSFLFNQKLVHFLVVFITLMLVSVNLTTKTRAEAMTEKVGSTIIAGLIESEFSSFTEEDSQLIVETFDRDPVITPEQQKYLSNLSVFQSQARASINNPEIEEEGLSSDVLARNNDPDSQENKHVMPPRTDTVTYVVQAGDTISTIAEKYGVSARTILWENDLSAYSIIRPGDELDILPTTGVSHSVARGENLGFIAAKYDVEIDEIMEYNKLADASSLQVGQRLVIPGGEKPAAAPAPVTPSYTGIAAIRDIVKPDSKQQVASNKMTWPTSGHRITQYYSWSHHGLDIADKIGTPLYAADAGTVEYVGWGTGYGNQIVINHGGGKKTRYAHLSRFYVKSGAKVAKGETIGAMGSTGWSTGPHVHFEVIINNVKYNPLNYIK